MMGLRKLSIGLSQGLSLGLGGGSAESQGGALIIESITQTARVGVSATYDPLAPEEKPWINPSNITTSGSSYTENSNPENGDCYDYDVRITLLDETWVGTNKKKSQAWSFSEEEITYGGSADTWGISLTSSEVKGEYFGFGISVVQDDPASTIPSEWIYARDFDFSSIPDGATIVGIQFTVDRFQNGGSLAANANNARCTIWYTTP